MALYAVGVALTLFQILIRFPKALLPSYETLLGNFISRRTTRFVSLYIHLTSQYKLIIAVYLLRVVVDKGFFCNSVSNIFVKKSKELPSPDAIRN